MINFEKIVAQLLEEHQEATLDFLLEATLDKVEAIYELHIKPRLTDDKFKTTAGATTNTYSIKKNLDDAYPSAPHKVPEETIIKAAITKLRDNVRGTGFKPENFIGLAEWFPILDLIALFSAEYKQPDWGDDTKGGKTISLSQPIYEKWELQLKNYAGVAPVLYKPLSPAGLIIQRNMVAGTNVGTMRFKDLASTSSKSSFYKLAKDLFEIRKKTKFKFLPNSLVQKFDLEGDKILNDIMYQPWAIIRGSYKISKELEEIYDHGIINMLTDLSLSLYGLYKAELNKLLNYTTTHAISSVGPPIINLPSVDKLGKLIEGDKYTKNPDLYEKFIGTYSEAVVIDYKPILVEVAEAPILFPTSTDPLSALTDVPAFKVDNVIENVTYLYNTKNLSNAADGDYTEAGTVKQELEEVANYITTAEPTDRLGGAAQLAKGLSFGVPVT